MADEPTEVTPTDDLEPQATTDDVLGTEVPDVSEPTSTEPVQAAEPDWRERYQGFGVDVNQFESEDQFRTYQQQVNSSYPQLQQYANIGQQVAPHLSEFHSFLSDRAKPQPQEPQPEPVDPFEQALAEHWKAPEYNERWDQYVNAGLITQNEAGMYVATDPVAAAAAQGLNEYRDFERNQLRQFAREGPQMLRPVIETLITDAFEKKFQQQTFQQQDNAQAQDVVRRNFAVFHEMNGNQPAVNLQGQLIQTPVGDRFYQYQDHLSQKFGGRLSPGEIAEWAEVAIAKDVAIQGYNDLAAQLAALQGGNGQGQQQQQVAPPAAPPPPTPQESFVARAEATASGAPSRQPGELSIPVNDRDMVDNVFDPFLAKQGFQP